jgi:tetratricopeptide (TPR) repeat protein
LIAVIARGGVGKTSLVLQTLSDFCLSSESISLSDGVAFVSLKQEKLGHDGIQLLDAPSTIDEVKEALLVQLNSMFDLDADGFNNCTSKLSDKRIWLFVDNLETVLRDSPSSFTEFYDTLPGPWKVIVTSRIPVDGGRNIPLDPLEEPGALAFARQYFETKGHPVTDVGLIQKIVTGCQNNPLAIRLTIDSFIAGKDISSALSKTSEEVTAFSFSNLLDVLPKEANDVLEGLFVLDNPTRSTLCEALQLSVDSIAAAIGSLVRTSLIVRTDTSDGETYSLGASIRELLRSHPRDRKTRTRTIDWINRTRASASETLKRQTENKVSPVDISFVPSGIDHSLISTANSVQSAVQKSDLRALSQLDIKIRSLLDGNPNCSFLHRIYGRVLFELDDLQAAEKHFDQAITLDNGDPAPKFALAYLYQKMQRLAEGRALCDELIGDGWGDEAKAGKDAKRVWSLYLTILNFSEELNSVFTYTQDWKAQNKAASVFGVARASAYRRQADQEFRLGKCDAQRVGKLICSALDELDVVSEIDGPSKSFQSELRKISGELDYYLNKKRLTFNQVSIDRIFDFIQKHKADIRRYCETDVSLLITRSVSVSSSSERTSSSAAATKSKIRISELKSSGYTIVTVKYLPKSDGFPSYVFAEDENNNTYYLHVDAFEDGDWREWVFVEKGTILAIKHQPNSTGNARKATEIRSITS